MSLVYDKGTILASKREAYDTATPENELKDRVNKQHKLICAAVKAGRVEDLKQMTASARSGAKKAKAPVSPLPEVATIPVVNIPAVESFESLPVEPPAPDTPPSEPLIRPEEQKIAPPAVDALDPFAHLPIIEIDGIEVVEEYAEIVPEAVEVVSELSGQSRPTHNRLCIDLIGDGKFRAGDRKMVNILISRGSDRKVVSGAQIMIKILGSAFRPVIFHARSDQNGLARVHLQVPQFAAGRAALLVRAIAEGEEVELRKIVAATP
jgi:hypothetical protein